MAELAQGHVTLREICQECEHRHVEGKYRRQFANNILEGLQLILIGVMLGYILAAYMSQNERSSK